MLARLAVALFAIALPTACLATNGLSLIGFGTESVAMGGADTAVARDTTALNTNPAGLTQLSRPAFDAYPSLRPTHLRRSLMPGTARPS